MSFGRIFIFIEVPIMVTAAFLAVLRPPQLPDAIIISFGALAILLLVSYIFVVHQSARDLRKSALGPARPEHVDIADLVRAESFIDQNYPLASVDYFLRILTDTPSYLSRVDERMELDGRNGTVHTTLFFRRASTSATLEAEEEIRAADDSESAKEEGGQPNSVLFPLVSVRKGHLFDRFEAHDQSGAVLPTLSQWEVRGLLVVALRALFTRALTANLTQSGNGGSALTKEDRHTLLLVALGAVCATRSRNQGEWNANVERALRRIRDLDGRFDKEWKKRIMRFCASLAQDYLIVVEVPYPQGSNMVLSYKNVVTATRVNRTFEQRLRAKHGLAPVIIDAPMTWASLPDSYHFELQAPPTQFVFDHHLERLETTTPLKQEDFQLDGVQQYVRLHDEKARDVAHLYIRRVRYNRHAQIDTAPPTVANQLSGNEQGDVADELKVPDFKSVIRFKEVPPGTLGNAVTIAFFTTAVIAYSAFVYGVPPSGSSGTTQGILSLLLAFPAFIAAAFGRGITSENVRATSLTTFYGLWVVVLTSVTAVLMFISDVNRFKSLNFSLTIFGLTQRMNIAWVCLALLSITTYLLLRKEKSDHRTYYLRILNKTRITSTERLRTIIGIWRAIIRRVN